MITAIMQPYFFPYVGYFQLMAAVELFIVYDDAQFMKGGWVNRNRILVNGEAHWWTYPLQRDDHTLAINARHYQEGVHARTRLHAQLANAYRDAPHYEEVIEWVHTMWPLGTNVAEFNESILVSIAGKMGLRCRIRRASTLPVGDLRGEDRVLALCKATKTSAYVNASGGVALYDRSRFREQGMDLEFLAPSVPTYPQFSSTPVPGLSIIDVLMFRGFDGAAEAAARYGYLPHG